jgi:hypothetical protein
VPRWTPYTTTSVKQTTIALGIPTVAFAPSAPYIPVSIYLLRVFPGRKRTATARQRAATSVSATCTTPSSFSSKSFRTPERSRRRTMLFTCGHARRAVSAQRHARRAVSAQRHESCESGE